ncbi:hypothetical protein ACFL1N_10605 [Thermodesulfobacteriota bacterium]
MFEMKCEESLLHPDWPEIKWNISGLFNYRLLIGILTNMMKNQGISHVLGSFHGSPDLIWNGGRINANVRNYDDSEKYFKTLNDQGIGVFLTFSNAIMEKKHLDDPDSNQLLDCLDEKCGLNGVIIVNDLMSEYIRKKKPGLKQICSIVKSFIENPKGDIKWYREMENRFDRVVIHTDHIFDLEILDKLDRDKAEILITEECVYKCPNRSHHQTLNSVYNIARNEDEVKAEETLKEIGIIRDTKCAGGQGIISEEKNPDFTRSCYMMHDEVKTIYDLGFRQFKISGRRRTVYGLAWNVLNFVFNPDLAYIFERILYTRIDQKVQAEFTEMARKKGVLPPRQ